MIIELCMGSSCYARGNAHALSLIERMIEARGLENEIEVRGHLCMGTCAQGPIIRIDGEEMTTPELSKLEGLLAEKIAVLDDETADAGRCGK